MTNLQTVSAVHEAIRAFQNNEETFVRTRGIESKQYLLLIAVHSLALTAAPTIKQVAGALFLQHHSTVELVTRAIYSGLVLREKSTKDRREVFIRLTALGTDVLTSMAEFHRIQVELEVPTLTANLLKIAASAKTAGAVA